MKSSNPNSGCRKVEIAKTLDTTDPNPCKNQGGIAIVEVVPYTLKIRSGCEGGTPREGTAGDTAGGSEATDRDGSKRGSDVTYNSAHPTTQAFGFCARAAATAGSIGYQEEVAPTLRAGMCPDILYTTYDARGNGDGKTVSTLTGDHENRITDYTSVVCMGNGQLNQISMSEQCNTLDCMHDQQAVLVFRKGTRPHSVEEAQKWEDAVVANTLNTFDQGEARANELVVEDRSTQKDSIRYIVRRLTPLECARLQGFPDWWSHVVHKDSFTEEEYLFWLAVRNTHASVNGKAVKDYTKEQMLKWYNGLHTDSAEYKMWGNGIALPPALYVMQGIKDVLERED